MFDQEKISVLVAENEALNEKLQAEEERRKLVLTDIHLVTHIKTQCQGCWSQPLSAGTVVEVQGINWWLPVFHWADADTNNQSQALSGTCKPVL